MEIHYFFEIWSNDEPAIFKVPSDIGEAHRQGDHIVFNDLMDLEEPLHISEIYRDIFMYVTEGMSEVDAMMLVEEIHKRTFVITRRDIHAHCVYLVMKPMLPRR